MCLGVPGRVLEVHGDEAVVDFFGVSRHVRLELVDQPVEPGDYILNHVGTLRMYEELLRDAEAGDLMAGDVRAEVEATYVSAEAGAKAHEK